MKSTELRYIIARKDAKIKSLHNNQRIQLKTKLTSAEFRSQFVA